MNEPSDRPLDLLVLDDHAIVRQGVMMLVQPLAWIRRCRGAASLEEAVGLMEEAAADLAVVDLSLKRQSGLDAIGTLLQRWPGLRIVVLSMHADPIHCQRALQRGALGFVAKDDASDELAQALEQAARRQRYLSSSVRSLPIGAPPTTDEQLPGGIEVAVAQLTQRERQVLAMIGHGKSVAEVAQDLGRSVKTVEAHRNNLREKLGLKNNRQLLQFSAKWVQFDSFD